MTTIPFFTVIIPTRNRVDLFKDALQSVLLQDFDDFDVLVSDNSTDDNTQIAIESFRNHPKLTLYRTNGNLSMPQHWEFITQKARGLYVLIVTDRSVLKQHALRTIYEAISSSVDDVLVCSWRWSLFDDNAGCEYADFPMIANGKVVSLASHEIAQNFVNGQDGYPYDLPRTLNSCYRNDIAAKIRTKYGALFFPISPDYTSAFLLLAHVEKILFLDTALFISQGLNVSNGGNCQNSMASTENYLSTLGISDYYAHVPIKSPLVDNTIFEDFLAMQELAKGELTTVSMNWVEYFIRCHKEINSKMGMEKEALLRLENQWRNALKIADKNTYIAVKKRLSALWWGKVKAQIKKIKAVEILIIFIKKIYIPKKQASIPILVAAGHIVNE